MSKNVRRPKMQDDQKCKMTKNVRWQIWKMTRNGKQPRIPDYGPIANIEDKDTGLSVTKTTDTTINPPITPTCILCKAIFCRPSAYKDIIIKLRAAPFNKTYRLNINFIGKLPKHPYGLWMPPLDVLTSNRQSRSGRQICHRNLLQNCLGRPFNWTSNKKICKGNHISAGTHICKEQEFYKHESICLQHKSSKAIPYANWLKEQNRKLW